MATLLRSPLKRAAKADDWWDQPTTIPAPDSATVRRAQRWRRLVTGYVWAAVILLPIALLAVFLLAGRQLGAGANAADRLVSGTQEAAQAQVALERWMAQEPSPLPGGRVVALIDATSEIPEPQNPGDVVDYRIATYRFVVADNRRTLYTTGVQLAITPAGPVLLAQPALLPIPAGAGVQGGQWPWPGVESGTPQEAYTPAISAWLTAYSSGDPTALKQVVGDPDAARSYLPLSGVRFSDPAVGAVGWLWGDDQNRAEEALPHQALLRVSVATVWSGQTAPADGSAPRLTYDLLLDKADTAAPVVVAWGSPGSPLAAYGNAVSGAAPSAAPPPSVPPPSPVVSPGPSAGTSIPASPPASAAPPAPSTAGR